MADWLLHLGFSKTLRIYMADFLLHLEFFRLLGYEYDIIFIKNV